MNLFERINTLLKPPSNRDSVQDSMLHAIAMQARYAHDSEDYEHALELYHEAQKIAQNSPSVMAQFQVTLQMADTLIQKQDYAQAEELLLHAKHLAEVQHIRSLSAYILCSLGVLEQAKGHIEIAQEHYEHARALAKTIRAYGAQGRATAHLGDLALIDNNLSYAIHLLREAIPLMERSGDTDLLAFSYGRLGTALIASGQSQQGKHVLNKSIEVGLERRQIAVLRDISLQAAEYAIAHQDYTVAYHHYSNAIKLFPHPDKHRAEFVKTHAYATYSALKLKKIDDAQRLLNATQSLATTVNDNVSLMLADSMASLVHYEKRAFTETIEWGQKALEFSQNNPLNDVTADLWHVVAQSYAQTNVEKALEIYQTAIEKTQQTQQTRYEANFVLWQGDLQLKKVHHREKALQDYQTALKQYEQLVQIPELTLVQSKIALIEAQMGQGSRAIKRAEQALLQLNSVNDLLLKGKTLENIADIYIDYADIETTEGLYTQALEIAKEKNVDLSIRHAKLGYLFVLKGQAEKGVIELTLARNQSREIGEVLQAVLQTSLLGVAYRYVGDTNTALAHHYEAIANLNYEQHPEETALLQLQLADTLFDAQKAIGQTRQHYDNALNYAQKTDNALLIFATHLGIAKVAIYEKDMALADEKLQLVQNGILKSHSKRLQAELKTLQSRYFARINDYKKAEASWAEADILRRMLQMPPLQPTWL